MKKLCLVVLAVFCLGVMGVAADDDTTVLTAHLKGINETPPIATQGTGDFVATIHPDGTINFHLTFSNLETNAFVSHIHFGQPKILGGVMIFLCGGGGQPACPASTSGTVDGTITAANVTGPVAQGIEAGDLTEALQVIFKGVGYVNVHSTRFPGGEIRGPVQVRHGDGDGDDKK